MDTLTPFKGYKYNMVTGCFTPRNCKYGVLSRMPSPSSSHRHSWQRTSTRKTEDSSTAYSRITSTSPSRNTTTALTPSNTTSRKCHCLIPSSPTFVMSTNSSTPSTSSDSPRNWNFNSHRSRKFRFRVPLSTVPESSAFSP